MEVSEILKEARTKKGMTQQELADTISKMKEEGKIADGVVLNQWTDCYLQMQNGEIQGVIVDKPVGEPYLNSNSDKAKFVGDSFGEHEEFAFAVKKGNKELLDKLNTGLANIKENGKYQLNLWRANELIFEEAGILKENYSTTNVCTCCNPGYLFSHRASKGKRGNLGAFLQIKE